MDLEKIKETRLHLDGLSKTLGMEFISTPEPDTCQAKMKVDEKNRQVFGFLSGGIALHDRLYMAAADIDAHADLVRA